MKNYYPTITVGIAAYNEEKNIKKLLKQILKQRQTLYKLTNVLIYADACTDSTIAEVKSVKDKKIKLLKGKSRVGKVGGLSRIFQETQSNILVIFDADIKLKNNLVLEKLASAFLEDDKVMLAGGYSMPMQPNTFFEKAVYSTFQVFSQSRKKLNGGNNIFGCNGQILALRKDFLKGIKFPNVINEDDYLYFLCLLKGHKFKHVNDAVIYYKLPKNLGDYLKQVFRSSPDAITLNFEKYFGDIVKSEYHRPIDFYAKCIFAELLKNPIGVAYISLVNIFCKPLFPVFSKNYKLSWYTAKSTK